MMPFCPMVWRGEKHWPITRVENFVSESSSEQVLLGVLIRCGGGRHSRLPTIPTVWPPATERPRPPRDVSTAKPIALIMATAQLTSQIRQIPTDGAPEQDVNIRLWETGRTSQASRRREQTKNEACMRNGGTERKKRNGGMEPPGACHLPSCGAAPLHKSDSRVLLGMSARCAAGGGKQAPHLFALVAPYHFDKVALGWL